jgi:hypothetical protein
VSPACHTRHSVEAVNVSPRRSHLQYRRDFMRNQNIGTRLLTCVVEIRHVCGNLGPRPVSCPLLSCGVSCFFSFPRTGSCICDLRGCLPLRSRTSRFRFCTVAARQNGSPRGASNVARVGGVLFIFQLWNRYFSSDASADCRSAAPAEAWSGSGATGAACDAVPDV